MKKVLLMTVAMMTMSVAANAQETAKLDNRDGVKVAQMAPVAAMPCDVQFNAAATKTSRRTIADGVSYGRPYGSFYISGTSSNKYLYLYIPPIKEVTYKNYATDKANAKWQYGSSTLTDIEGDENNDLTEVWPQVDRGYINSSYIPTLSVGGVSYKYADELTPSRVSLINGDSILTVSQVNRLGGYYYGFSDASIFGTGDRNISVDGATVACKRKNIVECFAKPIVPFCLSSFDFPVVSWNDKITETTPPVATDFIPEGKQVTLKIIKMTEDGYFTNEVMAEVPITSADIETGTADDVIKAGVGYGFVSVSRTTQDDFGTDILDPIVIDYPFAVVLDGFDQEGVNFSLYMVNVEATERDWYELEGGVEGTLCQYVRKDNGEQLSGYYYVQTYPSSSQYKRQYNALIYLTGMYDYAELVDEVYAKMTAPVEGGVIYAEYEEDGQTVQDPSVQYYTICTRLSDWEGLEGTENYYFKDLPDWLTVTGYDDSYFEKYNATIAQITAEPLPSGVQGRSAEIHLVSDKGADAGAITVVQGSIETGISATKANAKVADAAMFNMAGQRVNDSFKGLVIKNGQKFMNK